MALSFKVRCCSSSALIVCSKRFVSHSQGLVTGLSVTSSLTNKALVSLQKYKMKEAADSLKSAEKLLFGQKGPKPFDFYVAKSLYFLMGDRVAAAQSLFTEARGHYPHLVGDGDFAWMLMESGKYKECVEFVERKRLNEHHSMDKNYYHWYMMAGVHGGLKEYEEALDMNTKCMLSFEEWGDHDNQMALRMKFIKQRGEILCALNRYQTALDLLETEIEAFQQHQDAPIHCKKPTFFILKSFWIRSRAQFMSDHNVQCEEEELGEIKKSIKQMVDGLTAEESTAHREIMSYCIGTAHILGFDIYQLILEKD